jgi:hypothetical protein
MKQECHATEDEADIDVILFVPIASAIPKWWTFKLLRWLQK